MRRDMTDAERALWNLLKGKHRQGWKFRRQQPLGAYIADFYCAQARFIIEIDGGQHAAQAAYDARRDAFLREAGYRVLRFWNHEVLTNREGVVQRIVERLVTPHASSVGSASLSAAPPQGGSR